MRRNDLTIVAVLGVVAVIAGFWMLVLSPKRQEASDLGAKADELRAAVTQQEQLVAYAEQARKDFDGNYRRLVVLGKAVPADADTASLLVQLQHIAERSGVEFWGIARSESAQASSVPAPAPPPPAESGGSAEPATTTTTPAPATEATAAGLPIGASVGPAGLPVLPYNVEMRGSFLEVADFLERLDGLVRTERSNVVVGGRLVTVDGFALNGSGIQLALKAYVTPAEQGLALGATPAGPSATAVPTTVTTTPTTAPTAAPPVSEATAGGTPTSALP